MARYGQQFKDAVMARLLPPESSSLEAVSQKVGISVATLERWRAGALAANDGNGSPRQWTPAARLEAVIATAVMDEAARSAWCREHGLYPADLDRWKQDALGGLAGLAPPRHHGDAGMLFIAEQRVAHQPGLALLTPRDIVAMLMPIFRETASSDELSGGSKRATTASLNCCP